MEKIIIRFERFPWWVQWALIGVLAVILYIPVIGNTFVSDDYFVLRKVCIDHKLNTDGFFRPLSDITLYLNYLIGGFNPIGYYLTNILVHALDALLLFHFCRLWRWTRDSRRQLIFAGMAALLFLCYPFHSEPVVWILGRACLLANTFGIMALVIMVSDWKEQNKIMGAAVCYFIAMTAYESVMVLPAMIIVWLLANKAPIRRHVIWMLAMIITIIAHFIIRTIVAGSVTGDYGAAALDVRIVHILERSMKVIGRFILPPIQDTNIMTVLFIVVAMAGAFLLFRTYKRIQTNRQAVMFFISQALLILIACLISFVFGVSTHTSESDRLLHFPSFFFCALIAFILVNLLQNRTLLLSVLTAVLVYYITCLQLTLGNWKKASVAINSLLEQIKARHPQENIYIINLPEEIDGAYIFRAGFQDALLLNKLDTAGVIVINREKRDSLLQWPGTIIPQKTEHGLLIPPSVSLEPDEEGKVIKQQQRRFPTKKEDIIIYWNKETWKAL